MPITDWPEAERPREKLLARGPGALSDAELLAIFLRTGVPGRTAVDLARDLLRRFGGLRGLLAAERASLCAAPGLGPAKYAQLREVVRAALELNAAALIVAHNHPSGVAEPSAADAGITQRLREALALVDVRLLDHLVVGDGVVVSLAERGLL